LFGKMRRNDRKITAKEAKNILKNGEYGVLSTINKNEYPYGIPVNYFFRGNTIYIHCAVDGQKLENIKNNKKVSFVVIGKTEILPDKFGTKYESAIVFGKAQEVYEKEKHNALVSLLEKYSPEFTSEGKKYIKKLYDKVKVIKISIEHLSGKARN